VNNEFLWGVATSAYQSEGGYNLGAVRRTNWADAEERGDVAVCGDAANFWNCYEADFTRCAELGLNAFRLGLEWSRLWPEEPGRFDSEAVAHYAARCRALIFPGEEDFGMTPLEINAAGRPVIAFRGGGALETVMESVTGVFFNEPNADSLVQAIENFETREWNSTAIRAHALRFGGVGLSFSRTRTCDAARYRPRRVHVDH